MWLIVVLILFLVLNPFTLIFFIALIGPSIVFVIKWIVPIIAAITGLVQLFNENTNFKRGFGAVLILMSGFWLWWSVASTQAAERAASTAATATMEAQLQATETHNALQAEIDQEVTWATSNLISAITMTRIRDVNCHDMTLGYMWSYDPTCDYTWAEYELKNNMRYLTVIFYNDTCSTKKQDWTTDFNNYGLDPLMPGQSIRAYCQESLDGARIDVCMEITLLRLKPDGYDYESIPPEDISICW